MRKRGKVDLNQPKIVAALRKAGAHVQSIANIGNGCPDLLVSHKMQWYVIEVKNGDLTASQQRLTADEAEWHEAAQAPVYVIKSIKEALEVIFGKPLDK